MYNDNTNSNFSIRTVILQFLFIALVIFLLMWLFPLKSDLNNAVDKLSDNESSTTDSFYDRIFNENVIAMKDAAKSYLTTPRLPKNVGDKVKLTLGEMLDKKIILPFVDKNGDACSTTDSYVEVTKYDDEFVMKVNLKCGEEENYLLVYMGCYDYCQTAVCEKKESDVKTPVIYSSKTNQPVVKKTETTTETKTEDKNVINNVINNVVNNIINNTTKEDKKEETKDPEPTPTPDVPVVDKEYLYEYIKTTNGYYTESDWSDWSTDKVSANSTTATRTKTVTQKVLTGYNVTTYTDKSKPIYETKVVSTGVEEIEVCDKFDYVSAGSTTTSSDKWSYAGYVTLYSVPTSTSSVKYEYVKTVDESCNENCSSTVGRIYKKYVKSSTTVDLTKYACTSSHIQKTYLYTTVKNITGYETTKEKEPVYEYKKVKYYSYKTRTWHEGTTDKKWSTYNDTTLLTSGYQYTGNKMEK